MNYRQQVYVCDRRGRREDKRDERREEGVCVCLCLREGVIGKGRGWREGGGEKGCVCGWGGVEKGGVDVCGGVCGDVCVS